MAEKNLTLEDLRSRLPPMVRRALNALQREEAEFAADQEALVSFNLFVPFLTSQYRFAG